MAFVSAGACLKASMALAVGKMSNSMWRCDLAGEAAERDDPADPIQDRALVAGPARVWSVAAISLGPNARGLRRCAGVRGTIKAAMMTWGRHGWRD